MILQLMALLGAGMNAALEKLAAGTCQFWSKPLVLYLPRLRATSVRAYRVKILFPGQESRFLWMLFAFDRKAVVDVTITLQLTHERDPYIFSFATVHERFWISDHYEGVSRS